MRKAGFSAGAILTLALASTAAFAQQPTPSDPPRMPQWDASGTFGIEWSSSQYYFGAAADSHGINDVMSTIGVGRYFSQHLKAEAAVALNGKRDAYSLGPTETPRGGTVLVSRDGRPTGVSLGATYQFFENAFVHPFVTAGANVLRVPEHRMVETLDSRFRSVSVVQEDNIGIRTRPFVALGCKSYFNERVFMRSELHVAFAPDQPTTMLRIGAGVDF